MWNNVRYILLTAQRDSIFIGLAVAIVFGTFLATFFGGTALTEADRMAMVYAAGISRITVVLGIVIFIAFSIRRSFENKEIDQMIVRPISRDKFILSYWLGFSLVSFFFVAFTTVILYFLKPDMVGLLVWSLSLLAETLIVVSLAMAASMILRSTVIAVMLCIGFYVLSRMSGFLLMIVTKPGSNSMADVTFGHISKIIPRLDFFAKTEWLVYGLKDMTAAYLFLAQAGIYISMLLMVAIIDFKKKQF